MPTQLLTVDATADRCSVSKATLYRIIAEDGSFPTRIRLNGNGSIRFATSEVDAWIDEQAARGKWQAYRAALESGGGIRISAAAHKLGLLPEEVVLHRAVIEEHARQVELAGDLDDAKAEIKAAFSRPAETGGCCHDDVLRLQRLARHRLTRAEDAQKTADTLLVVFPRLFNLDPAVHRATADAWMSLPQQIRADFEKIEEAKSVESEKVEAQT